jgi:hypothetical protein
MQCPSRPTKLALPQHAVRYSALAASWMELRLLWGKLDLWTVLRGIRVARVIQRSTIRHRWTMAAPSRIKAYPSIATQYRSQSTEETRSMPWFPEQKTAQLVFLAAIIPEWKIASSKKTTKLLCLQALNKLYVPSTQLVSLGRSHYGPFVWHDMEVK